MMDKKKTFVGFGFGPIQSALFLYEAFKSGNFSRFVVADVDTELVESVRNNGGEYFVNIAKMDGIVTEKIEGVEIYNPLVEEDREKIIDSVRESDEMCTALPSVSFYGRRSKNGRDSVSDIIVSGLLKRERDFPTVIYTAENNNRAAEILKASMLKSLESLGPVIGEREGEALFDNLQILNTVIGKMSGVIRDLSTIKGLSLTKLTRDLERAVLVEEFNRILISGIKLKNFRRGIEVFIEKEDLLPFEEAKLYGHNAIHALIAYLGDVKGYTTIGEAGRDEWIMEKARRAFLDESGAALIAKYHSSEDYLFSKKGYREYAEDLLVRMVNPHLNDTIERVGRDRPRKLGIEDRLFGTMILALDYKIEPINLALGAAAGVISMIKRQDRGSHPELRLPESPKGLIRDDIGEILLQIWERSPLVNKYGTHLIDLAFEGYRAIEEFI